MDADASVLPQRLKAATHEWHARAERSGVMAQLLGGTISRDAYVGLLANLQALYAALETGLQNHAPEPLLSRLARSAALQADLTAFGATVAPALPLTPSTLAYVARLQSLGSAQAHRLWAHVYVRYLGDLHGGQILSRIVQERFALRGSTHFYEFGDAQAVQALRTALRQRLCNLGLDSGQANETVAEAVWAFEAHCKMFEQLQA